MLAVADLHLSYGKTNVLSGLSFSVDPGEIVGIIGNSGIGKTSLLKLMSGYLDSSSGNVFIDGREILGPSQKLVPGYEEIQLVNQDFELDVNQTVEENIRGKILHMNKLDQQELVDEALDLVELEGIRSRCAKVLSGGEKQRLSIARALVCEPKYLLMDEPFVHLDQRLRLKITNYLLKLNEIRNITIVLVSHDGSELLGFVNRLIHLGEGTIIRDAAPLTIYYSPDDKEQGELLGILNEVKLEGETVLFRPNEYSINDQNAIISLVFERSIDSGMLVLNYFKTKTNETIVLSANASLSGLKTISILKHES
ncbi:MAG: ABC-type multidrug transport system ATPase subunit [Flavobacteriaceae bacterium]|jgi:ABC-type multidrug transport system ATPase subunit